MKKLFFLLSIFAIFLSCSSDETSTPVTPPPAPIVKYTITLSAGEGGTVSTTGGEYEAGQTVSVTATPQGEYVFTSWSDGNTNATRTITVSSNSSLTANFEKRKYPLTVNFEGEGEVIEEIVNSGRSTDYDSGTTVKLTAQAAAEWVFVGWTGDIESTEESVQIVIGEPKEVTATFEKKKYPLSVNIEGEGEVIEEIIEADRTTDYDSGTTVKLTAQPEDEWLFTGWSGDIGDIDPTENPIQLNIIESKTVTATFKEVVTFSFSVPNYPSVNLKSGTILNNIYSPDTTISAEQLALEIEIYEDCDCVGCGCKTRNILRDNNYRFTDVDNDNKPDFFAFLGGNYDFKSTKYIFIKDFYNNPVTTIIDSDRSFAGLSEIGDFDGDGFNEIIVYSAEDHNDYSGGIVSDIKPLTLIDFNQDGSISHRFVGPPTSSHDILTLDFDNDGDLDIINFEWFMNEPTFHKEVPLVYINDGTGNFIVKEDLFIFTKDFYEDTADFIRTASDSFDLNNDGYLDLVLGYSYTGYNSNRIFNEGVQVVWGNEKGIFNMNEAIQLEIDLQDNINSKEALGFNFLDFNLDGYYDIIVTGDTDGYRGGYLDIYLNQRGQSFKLSTDELIDNSIWKAKRMGGVIPILYDLQVFDVNNDGLFDIRPGNAIRGDHYNVGNNLIMGPNTYWKNTSNGFILQEDYYYASPEILKKIYKTSNF